MPLILSMMAFLILAALPAPAQALPADRYQFSALVADGYGNAEPTRASTQNQDTIPAISPGPLDQELLRSDNPYSLDFDKGADPFIGPSSDLVLDDVTMANLDFNVPAIRTPTVDRHVQFFSYHIHDRFEQWLSRLERYRPTVQSIFSEFKLPLDLVFLSLVESGFNTHAVSRARAVGPWQFMTPTAKIYGLRVDAWVDERRDPVKSTIAAAQYLRDLYHLFGSWPLAMAAYNAGEGKVGRSLARVEDGDFWTLFDTRLLKSETKHYVPRFIAAAQIAKDPGRFGFNIQPQAPLEFEEVTITRPVHLKAAAKAAGVTFEDMKNLNPELRRDMTPPDPMYILKVPVGTSATMLANLPTYQSMYPAIYHEPKKLNAALQARSKAKASRVGASARKHKSTEWLTKGKPGRGGKAQVLAKATR
jgi:hypothetical protein